MATQLDILRFMYTLVKSHFGSLKDNYLVTVSTINHVKLPASR